MKKRVLFVDDDTLVLSSLRRMLQPMRDQWEMEFMESGEDGLELMARAPCDVVVSDMRMPGMDGAEFLTEVMRLYPRTVRLILTGYADHDSVLQCVAATHQFLAKPCDSTTLRATVSRALAMVESLKCDNLRRLAASMGRLPSLPSLYVQIVEALQSPEATLEEIGAIVARDIGMTAKLLKLVNSAFVGMHREILTAEEAVAFIGVDTIKALVLTIHAFSQFEGAQVPGYPIESLWDHSLRVGRVARAIAHRQAGGARAADEAFTAGLLHDAGRLVLAFNYPDRYAEVIQIARTRQVPLAVAEEQVFGATHSEMGGYLLGLWGLPVPVVEAISAHHRPADVGNPGFSPLVAIHTANSLVHELAPGPGEWPAEGLNLTWLNELGFGDCIPEWRENARHLLLGAGKDP